MTGHEELPTPARYDLLHYLPGDVLRFQQFALRFFELILISTHERRPHPMWMYNGVEHTWRFVDVLEFLVQAFVESKHARFRGCVVYNAWRRNPGCHAGYADDVPMILLEHVRQELFDQPCSPSELRHS